MEIIIIAAVASNFAIGKDNQLLYHLPKDMKRFKNLTTGNTVIMGRKTFQSLPKGALPNRRNIVLSNTIKDFLGAETFPSLKLALQSCTTNERVFIIGGASVYQQALSIATRLQLTEIHDFPNNADTFFPKYDQWKEIYREEHNKDERHNVSFAFVDYVK